MLIPETAAAMKRALRICAAVGAWFVTMNQPARKVCRWSVRIACFVITVFGADVPEGREGAYWIFGPQMYELFGHRFGLNGDPPPLLPHVSCMLDKPAIPGRHVRMSASGLTDDALIPNARSSRGVAT
jgi:hypothetical protein